MKAIIKTTSAINLIDPTTREMVEEIPRLRVWTQFLEARTGAGQIKVLAAGLPDSATDQEFQEYMEASDGKEALAVASFVEAHTEKEEDNERQELENEARELGIRFQSNTKNETLARKIAEEVASRVQED